MSSFGLTSAYPDPFRDSSDLRQPSFCSPPSLLISMKWLRHLFARGIASCSFKSSASSANTAQLIMSLPQEILDLIIDYVALLPPRYKTLEACALTCRSFYPRTLTCRFRHVNITGRNNIAPFINAMASTRLSHVQPLVTSISITFPLS